MSLVHSVVTVHGLGEQTLPRGFIINPVIQGAMQKSICNFEDQYPAFYFNKNHQTYTNTTL